jgi:hypothetical protein
MVKLFRAIVVVVGNNSGFGGRRRGSKTIQHGMSRNVEVNKMKKNEKKMKKMKKKKN